MRWVAPPSWHHGASVGTMTTEPSRLVLRIPAEDHEWLKEFVAQYPKDSLNAMMSRFVRRRIEELVADPLTPTPPYEAKQDPEAEM